MTSSIKPMNQHQWPPCRLAIFVILRNVPPKKLPVEANVSFCHDSVSGSSAGEREQSPLRALRGGQSKSKRERTMPDSSRLPSLTSLPIPTVIYHNVSLFRFYGNLESAQIPVGDRTSAFRRY